MLATPGTFPGYKLTRELAEDLARNWWVPLLEGLTLIVAGVLIFSIDWSVRSLATFIGALFIFEGVAKAFTGAIDATARRSNAVAGGLSVAAGVAIIAWPSPGLTVVAVFLGAWLIVVGTSTIAGAFAVRPILSNWWLWLIVGLLEVPLGVLALANPGATLAALITVAGIWAASVGVMCVLLAFEVKRLPHDVDDAFAGSDGERPAKQQTRLTATRT